MKSIYESASGAVLPWKSPDAGSPLYDALTQQEIDVCLMCPHHASACDHCNGDGRPRTMGRPRKQYDAALLREMLRLRKCNAEMCAALGISRNTLAKAKEQILKEDFAQ